MSAIVIGVGLGGVPAGIAPRRLTFVPTTWRTFPITWTQKGL